MNSGRFTLPITPTEVTLMTPPLSSSLDLDTLNAARKVASNALKAYVCELEQKALDAARCRDYQAAKLNSDWAFAADLCVSRSLPPSQS